MSDRLRWYLGYACLNASWFYAARMKRDGDDVLTEAMHALASIDGAEVVGGFDAMPSSLRTVGVV